MTEQNFAQMRTAMVESQLRTSDVNDARVVAAMAKVAREKFVPEGRRAMAYIDRPVRVDGGRAINPPLVTGRLITEANVKAGDKVLLIGAASGYGAAVLEALGAQVTAVENDSALIALAQDAGVAPVEGPLAVGAPANAPYDVLIIEGAVEEIPAAIVDQLADGARISTGLVERGVTRLCKGRKSGNAYGLASLADLEMVVLPGFAKPVGFVF